MRIGIDVGGTNTDAALMAGRRVVAVLKTPTTKDVTSGIVTALDRLLVEAAVDPVDVTGVMIGTTHFTNAVVEGRRLARTAAIRLGAPATLALPPLVDWPDRLLEALGRHTYVCRGGHEFDGREISPLDTDELRRIAVELAEGDVRSVAVTSVFSPVNGEMETEAGSILNDEVPELSVSLSREIGRIGLLERENATVLNASLRPLAEEIVQGFEDAVEHSGLDAPIFISQNDGTLMSLEYARRYPVATFASGPTNSMRGAAFLSGQVDCAVVDVGGTTADIGVLTSGFPREASVAVDIGGVRTNFRMPDVLPIGIGGGSLVRGDVATVTVGPDSVGYELTDRALVFGGSELTATDIAVAGRRAEIGNTGAVAGIDPELVEAALARIRDDVAETVDRMKTSAEPIPVVLVGGGSILLPDDMSGASQVIRPENFEVANAIGAAIAQVGGEVDRIYSLAEMRREAALESATAEAIGRAIGAGAAPVSVEVVDVEEVPLAYLPSNAVRIRVKAVGDLAASESK